jgi:multiple sugar transport system substrate-binding protein
MKKLLLPLCLLTLAGCASAGEAPVKENAVSLDETKPITLTWVFEGGQAGFDGQFGKFIYEKWPNVKVNVLSKYDPAATDEVPDVLDIKFIQDIQRLLIGNKIEYDLTEEAKKANYDLGRIEKELIDGAKAYSNGKLYALPYKKGVYGTYVNLDLFDRFGIPYPSKEKALTWQELLELGKKFNRSQAGVQYVGVVMEKWHFPLMELSPQGMDVKANKTRFLSDPKFSKYFDLMDGYRTMYQSMPEETYKRTVSKSKDVFEKDRVAALFPRNVSMPLAKQLTDGGTNWDFIPFPVWGDAPVVGAYNEEVKLFAMSKTNPHKEMTFKIFSHLLSDEVQTIKNKAGGATVLSSRQITDTFALEVPAASGKNIKSLFSLKPAEDPAEVSKLELELRDAYLKKTSQFLTSQKDKNTILREMDEEFGKIISQENLKK